MTADREPLAKCKLFGSKIERCEHDPNCPWHGECPATRREPPASKPGDAERLAHMQEWYRGRHEDTIVAGPLAFMVRQLDAAQSALAESEKRAEIEHEESKQHQSHVLRLEFELKNTRHELAASQAEVARLKEQIEYDVEQCARIARDKALQQIELHEARAELARLRFPTGTREDSKTAHKLFDEWGALDDPSEMVLIAAITDALAAARAQGVREERERWQQLRLAFESMYTAYKHYRMDHDCKSEVAWSILPSVRYMNAALSALAPAPQPGGAQADGASGEGGGE